MINKISISNFKSIYKQDIELGRINVFIGENGSGKSNILEAIAMLSASKNHDLEPIGLINKGIRVAKPSLTFNSFVGNKPKKEIKIDVFLNSDKIESIIQCDDPEDIFATWTDSGTSYVSGFLQKKVNTLFVEEIFKNFERDFDKIDFKKDDFITYWQNSVNTSMSETNMSSQISNEIRLDSLLNFLIFNINTNALRGISNESKILPLGINGEGLDILLSTFNDEQLEQLRELNFISWLQDIHFDAGDSLKYKGYKVGRSTSDLYFTDKFMQKKNNIFSAENANEGALHILFYLALFISERTPSFFAIDNIETALNPLLCRQVIKSITELSKKNDKQVLITTHNPAVIDGLNLHDDEQRLFVVKRTDEGHTKVERIKMKPNADDQKYKLSELWMRGYLGGLPSNIF